MLVLLYLQHSRKKRKAYLIKFELLEMVLYSINSMALMHVPSWLTVKCLRGQTGQTAVHHAMEETGQDIVLCSKPQNGVDVPVDL